ncbi:rhoGTPase activating protein isoform X2 [Oratosquilla oratoria]|uniref:rhoGTPase activating protein isoform X2 n=1 Tax=Oratosquilla oratoria TaxID=337810 RepID=UPI003F775063
MPRHGPPLCRWESSPSDLEGARREGLEGTKTSATSQQDDLRNPYSEIELYLQRASEEINAVFVGASERKTLPRDDSGTGRSRGETPPQGRAQTPARPPPADAGQASPSKIRKVHRAPQRRRTEPSPPLPRRLTPSSPRERRRFPLVKKPRRISAPAGHPATLQGAQASRDAQPWRLKEDPVLREWSQSLMRDFQSLVEAELKSLNKTSLPPPAASNGDCAKKGNGKKDLNTPKKEEDRRVPSRSQVRMGGSQSVQQDPHSLPWETGGSGGERSPFLTYTLPRSSHRSISLSTTKHRMSAAHPDDHDVQCQLLRVNPRFSRSYSLDEGRGLSPWALHHLTLIDKAHNGTGQSETAPRTPPRAPPTPPPLPLTPPDDSRVLVDTTGIYGKIRKTGCSERDNEKWRPLVVEAKVEVAGPPVGNGWPAAAAEAEAEAVEEAAKAASSAEGTDASLHALSEEALHKDEVDGLPWMDQEDLASITDRSSYVESDVMTPVVSETELVVGDCAVQSVSSCSERGSVVEREIGTGCQADSSATLCGDSSSSSQTCSGSDERGPVVTKNSDIGVQVTVEGADGVFARDANKDDNREGLGGGLGLLTKGSSEGELLRVDPGPQEDGRRHTLPSPGGRMTVTTLSSGDTKLSMHSLRLPGALPQFTASSWETLPPADETEVELEQKPIFVEVRSPSVSSLSVASSASLNSSLSDISRLSIHDDDVTGTSWPSSPVTSGFPPEGLFGPCSPGTRGRPQGDGGHPGTTRKDFDDTDHQKFRRETRTSVSGGDTFKVDINRNIGKNREKSEGVAPDGGVQEQEEATPSPEPITGILQLTPLKDIHENGIMFSISIPEKGVGGRTPPSSRTHAQFQETELRRSYSTTADEASKDKATEPTSNKKRFRTMSENSFSRNRKVAITGGRHPGSVFRVADVYDTSPRIVGEIVKKRDAAVSVDTLTKDVDSLSLRDEETKTPCGRPSATAGEVSEAVKASRNMIKGRSLSLPAPRSTSGPSVVQPREFDEFMRAVEVHIRRGSQETSSSLSSSLPTAGTPGTSLCPCKANLGDASLCCHVSSESQFFDLSETASTTDTHVSMSNLGSSSVLDAATQTSPLSASRASSVTWLSECGCDDDASLEPCVSSLALSGAEDELDVCEDDEDDDEDDWSVGASLSSSPPHTPASMTRDDSSLSLSESLDNLDFNAESGIGTVSTRPSVSPTGRGHNLDLSGSNLSSEDTGLETSFERKIRRYIPNPRGSGRDSDRGQQYRSQQYRRRRAKVRTSEQWVRCEDQTTQTDPEPGIVGHPCEGEDQQRSRDSFEGLVSPTAETPSSSQGKQPAFRHTHSESHLDALTSCRPSLRGVSSEAALPQASQSRMLTPSAPTLPTLTEDKPPRAPSRGCAHPRPRHLPIIPDHTCSPHPSKASSAPVLDSRVSRKTGQPSLTPATTPSEDSSGETPIHFHRAQSNKELAELEAIEACKWLRDAGFPQYAQMYEELQFPLDLLCVEKDHNFLDPDSMQALFRRLRALNRCAKIRLDSSRKNNAEESDDEEQQCALSGNWRFQRHSRRWSRIVHDETSPATGGDLKVPCDSLGPQEGPDEVMLSQFKRSGSERIKDGAKAFLRRMESLKNKKKKRQNREGVVISGPKIVDDAHMRARVEELGCVDISPEASPELSSRVASTTTTTATVTTTTTTTSVHSSDLRHSASEGRQTTAEDSSSLASDHSQTSTPLFRSRRRRRFWRRGGGDDGGGGGGAYSDSECSPPTWRHYLTDANSNKMATLTQTSTPPREKHSGTKSSSVRSSRPGLLRHTGSLTYGKDSQRARDNFLANIKPGHNKGQENVSPLPSPEDERRSIYDNVPLIICNKSYHDYQPDINDSEASMHEGSGSSECTVESRDSPLPSAQDDEESEEQGPPRRATVDRWHSFNRKSYQPTIRHLGTQMNTFSAGQMLHLRKRALLRLTALMERYCPTNRPGWNWELPKFMRKMKTPDYRDRQVFGVPLLVITQRTGQPLPPTIQAALQYLRSTSLEQVGIFRKPGVRSRIQRLRELHESGDDYIYSSFGTCDIADMVKMYFRELPEVLLTNKLSETFIAIFQYLPAEHRLEALQCAVLLLPDENREALLALLTFLSDVAASAHHNQMNASNLAVCLAPSLFHLNVGGSGSSPLRRRAAGTPEQKDLHDNKAAHQCLTVMIQQVSQLQCVPYEMLANCRFTYLEQSQPVSLEDLGMSSPTSGCGSSVEGDWTSYMNACITSLLKEAREKSRGWLHVNCTDPLVEVCYRKVGDGHPLRLWKVTTEVEAPPTELLNRIIRERHLWDDSLLRWRVVTRLDRQAEVFQYMCNSMPPRPPVDYCVLRCWRSDMSRGMCVVVETSVEQAEAPVLVGGVRGIVLASRYLIQPCGSGKSRITHISRLDIRGRTPDWYNKAYGHLTALHFSRIRQSFQHNAVGPESKV